MSIVPGRDVPEVPQEWVDAVNKRIDDENHQDLCACDGWPDACRSYKPGLWDLGVSLGIAIGVLEPLIRERITAENAAPAKPDRAARLLERIQAEGGMWTGARAASALWSIDGWNCVPERGVQIMRKLVERGQLVVANPPRGQMFTLPFGPGGQTRTEWTNVLYGNTDPEQLEPISERLARERMRFEWHTALLRREVKYGPWVEVPADEAGSP